MPITALVYPGLRSPATVSGFFGDSIFSANAGGGERAGFYPADNRIDMYIQELRRFFC